MLKHNLPERHCAGPELWKVAASRHTTARRGTASGILGPPPGASAWIKIARPLLGRPGVAPEHLTIVRANEALVGILLASRHRPPLSKCRPFRAVDRLGKSVPRAAFRYAELALG